jgi:hypothetical protein
MRISVLARKRRKLEHSSGMVERLLHNVIEFETFGGREVPQFLRGRRPAHDVHRTMDEVADCTDGHPQEAETGAAASPFASSARASSAARRNAAEIDRLAGDLVRATDKTGPAR